MKDSKIKNLIFDLGGVILDLAVDDTLKAFSQLSGLNAEKVTDIFKTSPEFNIYEKGGMNDAHFRDFIRKAYTPTAADQEIDKAWNTMLLGLPKRKLDLLQALKRDRRVFLLSNTNGIHLNYINHVLLPRVSSSTNLDEYFHKAYYSHRMLKRKPERQIFEQVLEENRLVPDETLFLDDNLSNVEGAQAIGIKTLYVTHPDLVLSYFNE